MRIRLWTALAVCVLASVSLLATFCRVPAGEIIVPTAAQAPAHEDSQILPAISTVPPAAEQKPDIKPASLEYGVTSAPTTPSTKESKDKPLLLADPPSRVPTMLVNSRRVKLNFNISDVGPSGISTVELWATRDGKAWQRYSNEPPPNGPLVVCVAEEGRYGFSIVVRNGLGLAAAAPKTGDEPQIWVDIDETRPTIQLTDCHVGHGVDSGHLYVTWKASDSNMDARSIALCTSPSREGPWTTVASGIENTGSHTWDIPKDLPYQFYVRLEATDRAGNVGFVTSAEPMKCDVCRPKGTIIGVDCPKPVTANTPKSKEQEQVFNFVMGWTR